MCLYRLDIDPETGLREPRAGTGCRCPCVFQSRLQRKFFVVGFVKTVPKPPKRRVTARSISRWPGHTAGSSTWSFLVNGAHKITAPHITRSSAGCFFGKYLAEFGGQVSRTFYSIRRSALPLSTLHVSAGFQTAFGKKVAQSSVSGFTCGNEPMKPDDPTRIAVAWRGTGLPAPNTSSKSKPKSPDLPNIPSPSQQRD